MGIKENEEMVEAHKSTTVEEGDKVPKGNLEEDLGEAKLVEVEEEVVGNVVSKSIV